MARWGEFTWGDGTKWGVPGTPGSRKLTWAFEVDWDRDGNYNGFNDARKAFGMSVERGRLNMFRSDGKGFAPCMVGRLAFDIKNEDGRYDPNYVGGPLYGQLEHGRQFRLRVRDEATGIIHNVLAGRISDIRPTSAGGVDSVVIEGEDGLRDMEDVVMTDLHETIRIDDAVRALFEASEFPVAPNVGPVSDTLRYWWGGTTSMVNDINDLANISLGKFFVGRDGVPQFLSRYRGGLSPVATYTDADALLSYGIETALPWDVVKNKIILRVKPRTIQPAVEIWRLSEPLVIPAGQQVDVWADFTYNGAAVPAFNVLQPLSGTDFQMASLSGGADISFHCLLFIDRFSTTAKVTIQNEDAFDGVMTFLRLRGDAISLGNPFSVRKQDDESVFRRGPLTLDLDTNWLQSGNYANELAPFLLGFLKDPVQVPMFLVKDKPAKQFGVELFDPVQLSMTSRGISSVASVGYIKHQWADRSGENVNTIFRLEPRLELDPANYWTFTTSLGVTSNFAL